MMMSPKAMILIIGSSLFLWLAKQQGEKNVARVFCSSGWNPSIYATLTFIPLFCLMALTRIFTVHH